MLPINDILLQAYASVDIKQYATPKSATDVKRHRDAWRNCSDCPLCSNRDKVVLFRGKVPCDVLILEDAPGEAEDLLGRPLLGKNGSLLDSLISRASDAVGVTPKLAFTTLVSCAPFESKLFSDFRKPTKQEIDACSVRLREFVNIAKPRAIVTLGPVAKASLPNKLRVRDKGIDYSPLLYDVKHPWQVQKMPQSSSVLEEKRIVLKFITIFKKVLIEP